MTGAAMAWFPFPGEEHTAPSKPFYPKALRRVFIFSWHDVIMLM